VATRIRLARGGKRHRPYYRIVVAESRSPRDGKFIERIGSYDPLLKENKVTLDVERAKHWLNMGAKPSERVSKLLTLQGVEHALVIVPRPAAPAAEGAPAGKAKSRKGAKAPTEGSAEGAAEGAGEAPAEPAAKPKKGKAGKDAAEDPGAAS
jgi:small subunit ribosomal protein S16